MQISCMLSMLYCESHTNSPIHGSWPRIFLNICARFLLLIHLIAPKKNYFFPKFLIKFQNTNESKPAITTTFLPFLGSGSQQTGFLSTPSSIAPWMALVTLEVEHEIFEVDTKLWSQIIRQLHAASAKFSMENIIKVSCDSVKL